MQIKQQSSSLLKQNLLKTRLSAIDQSNKRMKNSLTTKNKMNIKDSVKTKSTNDTFTNPDFKKLKIYRANSREDNLRTKDSKKRPRPNIKGSYVKGMKEVFNQRLNDKRDKSLENKAKRVKNLDDRDKEGGCRVKSNKSAQYQNNKFQPKFDTSIPKGSMAKLRFISSSSGYKKNSKSKQNSLSELSAMNEMIKELGNERYYLDKLQAAYSAKDITNVDKYLIDQFSKYLKHLFNSNMKRNENFLKLKRFYPPVKSPNKKCLLLDLDETLIFAHNEYSDTEYDEAIDLYIGDGRTHRILVYYRPYLQEFLEHVSKHWEIGVFTSSSSIYANSIIQRIDPENKFFNFRLYKQSCYRDNNNHLIKDLTIMANRDIRQTLIVDNSIDSVLMDLENCVPCVPFYGDKKDDELVRLARFLDQLVPVKDVRDFNRGYFKFKKFKQFKSLKEIEQFLKMEI